MLQEWRAVCVLFVLQACASWVCVFGVRGVWVSEGNRGLRVGAVLSVN